MRRAVGRVQPGLDALRAGGVAAGVRGGRPPQLDGARAARGAGAVEEAGTGRAARPGDDHRQGHCARPGRAIRDGGRAGGGPATVRGGPADPARRISPAERLARWCRRNKVLAASIGVAAAALVSSLVLSLVHSSRQAAANERISILATNLERESASLKEERGRLKTALSESNRRMARLDLERGRVAFERGQIGQGMVWTLESLRMAIEAGDAAARHVALANLAAWRRSLVQVKQVFPHGNMVAVVAFSPDGKTIATGSWDKTARLWDLKTGRPIGPTIQHQESVRGVAFSPDGRWLATASNDKTARVWDVATGQPITPPLEHSGFVFCIAFSPDGRKVLTGCLDRGARLWDAATGRLDRPADATSSTVYRREVQS